MSTEISWHVVGSTLHQLLVP